MADLSSLERVIELTSSLMAQLEAQAFQDERFAELSMRQIFYLNTIIQLEYPTYSDLAHELNVTKPSVTAIVNTLIAKGYVKKVQDAEDRRAYHIGLTEKAQAFNQLHAAVHKRLAAYLAAALNADEVEQLAQLMGKALQGHP